MIRLLTKTIDTHLIEAPLPFYARQAFNKSVPSADLDSQPVTASAQHLIPIGLRERNSHGKQSARSRLWCDAIKCSSKRIADSDFRAPKAWLNDAGK